MSLPVHESLACGKIDQESGVLVGTRHEAELGELAITPGGEDIH